MLSSEASKGLKATGLWAAVEIAVRGLLGTVVSFGLFISGKASMDSLRSGPPLAVIFVVTLVTAMVLLAIIFKRRVTREQLELQDLGYRFERLRVITGLISGLLLFGLVYFGTSVVDEALFPGLAEREEALTRLVIQAGPIVVIAALLGNGVLGPVVEEFAWRGYIQHWLTRAWNLSAGLVVTALLFVLKHIVVDVSLARLTTLFVFAFALGIIRVRWGTLASTATHVTANLVGTAYSIVTILGR